MTSVLLVTCSAMPAGEPGGDRLVRAFEAAGAEARWVVWDDPEVDWAAADVVAVRSTWDYESRIAEFLAWAGGVGPGLLNGARVFGWNLDKSYLLELAAAGVPIVPTTLVEGEEELPPAIAAWDSAVVKPTVGAGGRGVVVFEEGAPTELVLSPGPWVVQPLVESIRTEGEHSVFVLGGEPVAQVAKVPGGAEIRVHERYGGATTVVDLAPEHADLARRTVAAAEQTLGASLVYARVDQLRLSDGSLVVSELEATEPGLYLDVLPDNAERFVTAVLAR